MNTDVLVPACQTFVAELDRAYPGRGTGSDGSLASSSHTAANPTSDHERGPAGSPSPGKVDAVDITDALVPGDDAASERAMYGDVIPRFQAHAGSHYWIHDDMICFRSEGWQPRSYAYAGPKRNRHTRHCHFNWAETSAAHHNTSPYGFKGASMGIDLTTKVGNSVYPTRVFRQFINDVWIIRDLLVGDAKGTAKAKLNPKSPLGQLFALPAKLAALDTYVRSQPASLPVTLSESDRADIAARIVAELPEYGPRKNTP
jgi:hypothetical protein